MSIDHEHVPAPSAEIGSVPRGFERRPSLVVVAIDDSNAGNRGAQPDRGEDVRDIGAQAVKDVQKRVHDEDRHKRLRVAHLLWRRCLL